MLGINMLCHGVGREEASSLLCCVSIFLSIVKLCRLRSQGSPEQEKKRRRQRVNTCIWGRHTPCVANCRKAPRLTPIDYWLFHIPNAFFFVCKFVVAFWLLWQLNYTKQNDLVVISRCSESSMWTKLRNCGCFQMSELPSCISVETEDSFAMSSILALRITS